VIDELKREDRIVLRYCDATGEATDKANPNGSIEHIAGICNQGRNVFGLMPHPERASEPILGSDDGRLIFDSILAASVGAR
jgi:phosphoribosylformylglycinamidine synthase